MTASIPTQHPVPPSSDPSAYQSHYDAFAAQGQPTSTAAWLERAAKVAEILAQV